MYSPVPVVSAAAGPLARVPAPAPGRLRRGPWRLVAVLALACALLLMHGGGRHGTAIAAVPGSMPMGGGGSATGADRASGGSGAAPFSAAAAALPRSTVAPAKTLASAGPGVGEGLAIACAAVLVTAVTVAPAASLPRRGNKRPGQDGGLLSRRRRGGNGKPPDLARLCVLRV